MLLLNGLDNYVSQVVAARDKIMGKKIALLIKIAPDLNMQQKEDVASVVTKKGASKLLFVCTM